MEVTKRLHIRIKGHKNPQSSAKMISGLAKGLNLKIEAQGAEGLVEVVAEGDKKGLWELVNKCTSPKVRKNSDEILFYFREISVV